MPTIERPVSVVKFIDQINDIFDSYAGEKITYNGAKGDVLIERNSVDNSLKLSGQLNGVPYSMHLALNMQGQFAWKASNDGQRVASADELRKLVKAVAEIMADEGPNSLSTTSILKNSVSAQLLVRKERNEPIIKASDNPSSILVALLDEYSTNRLGNSPRHTNQTFSIIRHSDDIEVSMEYSCSNGNEFAMESLTITPDGRITHRPSVERVSPLTDREQQLKRLDYFLKQIL